MPALDHTYLEVNQVRLHAVVTGPEDGPLVVLLHGFPEFWYSWRHQLAPLAEAGLRVVALDLRGYNTSTHPPGLPSYSVDVLAEDVVAIADVLGCERVRVVGHDWGGMIGWWLGLQHAARVDRIAILNCPHPVVFRRGLASLRNLRTYWYMLFFQLPLLPEKLLARRDFAVLADRMRSLTGPGAITARDLHRYREAWGMSSLTGMLNYYRAGLRITADPLRDRVVHPPLRMIWGREDPVLPPTLARASLDLCRQGALSLVERAGHFPHQDRPNRVNDELVTFLTEPP